MSSLKVSSSHTPILIGTPKTLLGIPIVPIGMNQEVKTKLEKDRFVVLYGGESVGKSSIARLHLRNHLKEFRYVVWFQASSPLHFYFSCRAVAQAVGIDIASSLDGQIAKITKFFEDKPACLFVFDALSHEVQKAIPHIKDLLHGTHQVIVLTQDPLLKGIALKQLTEEEAVNLLGKTIEAGKPLEIEPLRNFISIASHSPLAIILFGNYYRYLSLKENLSWTQYLQKLSLNFLDRHNIDRQILNKLLKVLEDDFPKTLKVLNSCAYFHSKNIPISLLEKLVKEEGQDEKLIIFEAIQHLSLLGLVKTPLFEPSLQYQQYRQLDLKELNIEVPARVQRILREIQKRSC